MILDKENKTEIPKKEVTALKEQLVLSSIINITTTSYVIKVWKILNKDIKISIFTLLKLSRIGEIVNELKMLATNILNKEKVIKISTRQYELLKLYENLKQFLTNEKFKLNLQKMLDENVISVIVIKELINNAVMLTKAQTYLKELAMEHKNINMLLEHV